MALLIAPIAARNGATPVPDAPVPVTFPRDDGPHDSAIEWWYFTGHLFTDDGARFGFEDVIFRARSGGLEGYISHVAVTDNALDTFHYGQRILGARGVSGNADVLDLNLNGWTMRGGNGQFALAAGIPGYALDLAVTATKPATLHDGDGYIDYGDGTASYYFSWTRMSVSGSIDLGQGLRPVHGEAWMDHQWGDFTSYRAGGWDWVSVQLANGTDVMLYVIRGPNDEPVIVKGSLVGPDGALTVLERDDFQITPIGTWRSPATDTTYPSGWNIAVPSVNLTLTATPSLPDQELDTRPTTGVVYWEGEVTIDGTYQGQRVAGLGYVELTGYAPYVPVVLSTPEATPVAPGG
jgi:predicted secreted hydrolase